jgi:hypothetical protein
VELAVLAVQAVVVAVAQLLVVQVTRHQQAHHKATTAATVTLHSLPAAVVVLLRLVETVELRLREMVAQELLAA